MKIHEFVWPKDRVDHIARHGLKPEEIEEACFGPAFVQRMKSHLLCPRSSSGWPLFILGCDSIS
jgi:hypothetical protein